MYKTDQNQAEIVKATRELGASVVILASVGKGCPDILVGYKNKNYLFEIKKDSKQKLTPDQVVFHQKWKGQIHVIINLDELLKIIC